MAYDLALIDASSWLHRAYHAVERLATRDGRPTGALTGCVATLVGQLSAGAVLHDARHIVAVFDTPAPTFRHTIAPDYKRGRTRHDDLRPQFGYVRDAFAAFGICTASQSGLEADDIIAAWAQEASRVGLDVAILTSDKDLTQLVRARDDSHRYGAVHMVDSMGKSRGAVYGLGDIVSRWGVTPHQMASLLSLTGDTVDGVPGVPGIGPKTAAQVLNAYGPNLRELYANLPSVHPDKVRQLLGLHSEAVWAALRLIQLPSPDCPEIEVDLESSRFDRGTIDIGRVVKFCQAYELRRLEQEIFSKWVAAEV